jgi:hypothetical protein
MVGFPWHFHAQESGALDLCSPSLLTIWQIVVLDVCQALASLFHEPSPLSGKFLHAICLLIESIKVEGLLVNGLFFQMSGGTGFFIED